MRKHRRNITVVNNEIDYDKLAEAIVKANTAKNVEEDNEFKSEEKLTLCVFFQIDLLYRL